jgi:hypothetical protein
MSTYVWEYTALRNGKEIEKGRCTASSLSDCLVRLRAGWKYGPPPDDWAIRKSKTSVEQPKAKQSL